MKKIIKLYALFEIENMNNLDVEKALKLPNLVKTGNFNFKTGLKTKGKIYIIF